MIADVAFDAPVGHPFSYRVPPGWTLEPGQRVAAPLGPGTRVGLVLGIRDGSVDRLKPLSAVLDPVPLVSGSALDLIEWISAQSFSSAGSVAAALLPPLLKSPRAGTARPRQAPADGAQAAPPRRPEQAPAGDAGASTSELLIGSDRDQRLIERIARSRGSVLAIVTDLDAAARWAAELAKLDPVVRLDSGVTDSERASAWRALADGSVRVAVGTRSSLLVPLGPEPTLVLVDEHEPTHRPPGHPHMHSRDIVLERSRRESARVLMTSATPSAEAWWLAERGGMTRSSGEPGAWPSVLIADTRGLIRREPLMPELSRALRETLAAGERAFLCVSRFASALGCEECGLTLRCAVCRVALSYSRAALRVHCRVCGLVESPPDTCPGCAGRRLTPFGWGVERVEHAVRRRFPRARIARYDPEARGKKRTASMAEAMAADVVIGTRGAVRLFSRGSLGLAALVSPDQLLRLPDFRAAERLFELLWAAGERVRPGGRLIVQSQNPSHHAVTAVVSHDLGHFYERELAFREELGYPPFRRLAAITIRAGRTTRNDAVQTIETALRGSSRLTVYPATPVRRPRLSRIIVKGDDDLPVELAAALDAPLRARGIIDVEVDPIEWQF
jgi:primosomal protein N' (replication factor Y) (superfamily II helicase)